MDVAVLEEKINVLTFQQQVSVESYIDFLLFQNKKQECHTRQPLDFSKYKTSTCVWNEDAQDFVTRIRSNDRF